MSHKKHLILVAALCISAAVFAQTPAQRAGDKLQPRQSSALSIELKNGVVAVQVRSVNDTLVGGEVNYAGVFNIGTDDGRPLLFNYPQEPFSSHFNLRVDGVTFSNDPFRTGGVPFELESPPTIIDDRLIACSYRAGEILVQQRLTPVIFSPVTGAVLIEYLITNDDPQPNDHQVGLLLEMDTNIDGNDAAPVLSSFGYSRLEQQFTAPGIPDYYQAFAGTIVSPGLVAQGQLIGFEATRPDQFTIGDWFNLSTVQWDYDPSDIPYGDSAVLLRWNEKNLQPGETRRVATYYGRGDVTTSQGDLTLHLTAPATLRSIRGQLSPNPFDVNLLVFNRGPTDANATQATLQLPQGLAFVSGEAATKLLAPSDLAVNGNATATWKVLAQCPEMMTSLDLEVQVSSPTANGNFVVRPITIPSCDDSRPDFLIRVSPERRIITAGESATYSVSMDTSAGFDQTVALSLWPPVAGITAGFSSGAISPDQTVDLTLATERDLLAGEFGFIVTGNSGGLARSDSLTLEVMAAAELDTTPPVVVGLSPTANERDVALDTDVRFEVIDDQSGVDAASIILGIGNRNVTPTAITPIARGFRVSYQPPQPFADDQAIRVVITARDLADPPNVIMPAIEDTFYTVKDSLAPSFFNLLPEPGTANVSRFAQIRAGIADDLTGIDTGSIRMTVNGLAVSTQVNPVGLDALVSFQPAEPFAFNDTVRVKISAADRASIPNADSTAFDFFVERDTLPPVARDFEPLRGSRLAAATVSIALALEDQQTGVDSSAIRLNVDGEAVSPRITGSPAKYELSYDFELSSLDPLADSVKLSIEAADLARPANRMPPIEYFYLIERDREPPFATGLSPEPNEQGVALNAQIRAEIRDSGAGVDSSSIMMQVVSRNVEPTITGGPAAYFLRYQPQQPFPDDELIEVSLQASDLAPQRNSSQIPPYSFRTVRDSLPPEIVNEVPRRFSGNVSPNSEILISLQDDLTGIDTSSIALEINGQPVTPQLELVRNLVNLRYQLSNSEAADDSIRIAISASDRAKSRNRLTDSYFLTTVADTTPPYVAARRPAPGATGVPPEEALSFLLVDDQSGVDTSTIVLQIDGIAASPEIELQNRSAQISYLPPQPWRYNSTVNVEVSTQDRASPPNRLQGEKYSFAILEDREPPFVTDLIPAGGSVEVPIQPVISFLLRDAIAGVDRASIRLVINDEVVTPEISGTRQALSLRYQPEQPFETGEVVTVAISAQDLSNPPNAMPETAAQFQTAEVLPDLIALPLKIDDELVIDETTEVIGQLRLDGALVIDSVRVQFHLNNQSLLDTSLADIPLNSTITLPVPVRVSQAGAYVLAMILDPADQILEANEDNNRQELSVQILERTETLPDRLIVKPIPFTPNRDGYNDVVEFDYRGLEVANPSLFIFDVNGIRIRELLPNGNNRFVWDGTQDNGKDAAPGVYLYVLKDGGRNFANGYVVLAR